MNLVTPSTITSTGHWLQDEPSQARFASLGEIALIIERNVKYTEADFGSCKLHVLVCHHLHHHQHLLMLDCMPVGHVSGDNVEKTLYHAMT